MSNPLCQATDLSSAKCICDYLSVFCLFLSTELYSSPPTGGDGGGMKTFNVKVYPVKGKLGKALSISGAG